MTGPKKDEIDQVEEYIFAGPLDLFGAGPFTLHHSKFGTSLACTRSTLGPASDQKFAFSTHSDAN